DGRVALAGESRGELADQPVAAGSDVGEAGPHVEVVHVVDRTATDRIVRMVLQQGPPQGAQGFAGTAAAERVQRLAALQEQSLAGGILLLDPDPGRVHAAQDRTVLAGDHLPDEDAGRSRYGGDELFERRDSGPGARGRPLE